MKIPERCIRSLAKIVIVSGIAFILNGCNIPVSTDFQSEIDSIAARYVPDKRIAICRIISKPGKDNSLVLSGETTEILAKNEIIKTLNKHGIALIDSIIILPDTISNERFMGLVTLSVINLRKNPEQRAELVSQAIMGTPVLILKNQNSWLLVQTPDRYIAWTEKSSISLKTRTEMNQWKKAERIVYTENSGWIKSDKVKDGIVGDLVAGCIMEKTGESGEYLKILLPDGRTGLVARKSVIPFLSFREQNLINADGIMKRALSLLGVPYLWGGSSTKGVDCSGFVQTVYFNNGRILQRDASLQALHGYPVDISHNLDSLKRGDLLFFGTREKTELHVTHVAIYMGDNDYINSSGKVMINSLDSTSSNYNSYRRKSLLSARRVVGVNDDPGIVPVMKHSWY
jgi:cell wall-associated NlpC family hydrolase